MVKDFQTEAAAHDAPSLFYKCQIQTTLDPKSDDIGSRRSNLN